MKRYFTITTALLGLSFAGASAAQDVSQLAAGAGLSRAEAQQLSLSEIAAMKLNRGSDNDERQAILPDAGAVEVDPARHAQLIAAAGLTAAEAAGMTLSDLAVAKFNAEARYDDRQRTPGVATGAQAGAQLIAGAGLTPAEARGKSLTEVAAAKFARDTDTSY
jgi:hypothetical protein